MVSGVRFSGQGVEHEGVVQMQDFLGGDAERKGPERVHGSSRAQHRVDLSEEGVLSQELLSGSELQFRTSCH